MKHLFVIPSLFILLFSGCGEPRPDGMPKLYPVTLTLEQEGKPLAEATVILVPQFPCTWTVGGITDTSGRVQLKTHGKHDGAPAGNFKICVRKTIIEGESLSLLDRPTAPRQYYEGVEPEYGNAETTPLEINIEPKRQTFPPFDAGKAIKVKKVAAPMTR